MILLSCSKYLKIYTNNQSKCLKKLNYIQNTKKYLLNLYPNIQTKPL